MSSRVFAARPGAAGHTAQGERAAALAPPSYGIDFVDRAPGAQAGQRKARAKPPLQAKGAPLGGVLQAKWLLGRTQVGPRYSLLRWENDAGDLKEAYRLADGWYRAEHDLLTYWAIPLTGQQCDAILAGQDISQPAAAGDSKDLKNTKHPQESKKDAKDSKDAKANPAEGLDLKALYNSNATREVVFPVRVLPPDASGRPPLIIRMTTPYDRTISDSPGEFEMFARIFRIADGYTAEEFIGTYPTSADLCPRDSVTDADEIRRMAALCAALSKRGLHHVDLPNNTVFYGRVRVIDVKKIAERPALFVWGNNAAELVKFVAAAHKQTFQDEVNKLKPS